MVSGEIRYFAYGSNLSVRQMGERCPGASAIGVAVLEGHRLAFTHHSSGWGGGVADIVRDQDGAVWGLLYALTEPDLAALDVYEGYPLAYDRFLTRVNGPEGPVAGVWTYSVVPKREHVPPTPAYLDVIRTAARELGFPEDYARSIESLCERPPPR